MAAAAGSVSGAGGGPVDARVPGAIGASVPTSVPTSVPDGALDAWRAVRADPSIQFAPVELPAAKPPPDWLTRLQEFLVELFAPFARWVVAHWDVIWPVLATLAGLFLILVLVQLFAPDLLRRFRRQRPVAAEAASWAPPVDAALALLDEADRLAGEGRFEEATHLLLTRSVGQIAALRPGLVEPSSTAREIARMAALPEAARTAFAIIATLVERSLFALRRLSAEDWQAARATYADFALAADRRLVA